MGMRAFVWFRMMVSFYGAFSCQIRAQVHLTLFSDFTKTWYLAYYWGREGCVLALAGGCLGRVGRVFGGCWVVWWRDVLEPVRGAFVVGWNVQNGWKRLDSPWECLGGAENAAFCLGRSRVRGSMLVCGCRRVFCQPWRWQIVELPIVSRRHLDRYSLLFRSFFACSSFGPR